MSISIGSVRNTIDGFTVNSPNSNVVTLNSATSNVLINIGAFTVGQTAQSLNITRGTSNIATFNESSIIMHQNVTFASDSSSSEITTNGIKINNDEINTEYINASSNSITLLSANTSHNGSLYIGGHIGVGTTNTTASNSIYAVSNIHTNTSIHSQDAYTSLLHVDTIMFNNNVSVPDSNNTVSSSNNIKFSSEEIIIDFKKVSICNLQIDDLNTLPNLTITNKATFLGLTTSTNMSLSNANITTPPLAIAQKLTNGTISNRSGNPISVISEMPSDGIYENIFQLSAYGHLIMGGNIQNTAEVSDYMIRGVLSNNRISNFDGFLYFSTSNNNTEGATFIVNKDGHLSIGNKESTSIFELNTISGEPTSMMSLSNTMDIPMMKCYSIDSDVLEITSNATLLFSHSSNNTAVIYDIDSQRTSRLANIETSSIVGIGTINMNNSSIDNLTKISSANLIATDATIETLVVTNFRTNSGASNSDVFTITNSRLLHTGNVFAIKPSPSNVVDYYSTPEYTSIESLSNSMLIYTNGTPNENINAYSIFGNNTSVNILTQNIKPEGSLSYEMKVNSNIFKIGVKDYLNLDESSLFITRGDHNFIDGDAINVYYNKRVRFGTQTHIHPNGVMYLGYASSNVFNTPNDFTTRLFINGGIFVNGVMNVTNNIAIGAGTAAGGPFTKQYGWFDMTDGEYRLSYDEYGGGNNGCAGTLYIQVQTGQGHIGNVGASFIKSQTVPNVDIFVINSHKSQSLNILTVTAEGIEIVVRTDSTSPPARLCWTSVGAC